MEQWEKDTRAHIDMVQRIMFTLTLKLRERAMEHDFSKLQEPERATFAEFTPKLAETTYGSDEYKQFLRDMRPALLHHYRANRHHPEHHPNGIDDMNILDLFEMLCDWMAATLRHQHGDLMLSIEQNQERFGYGDGMKRLMLNSVPVLKQAAGV